MAGNKIALDTNRAVAILNGKPEAARWASKYSDFYMPAPVLGELLFGALNSRRAEENRQRVEMLTTRSTVLHVDAATATIYANIRLQLKRMGRPIPENDLWIAAVVIQHNLPLGTDDAHFSLIPQLLISTM